MGGIRKPLRINTRGDHRSGDWFNMQIWLIIDTGPYILSYSERAWNDFSNETKVWLNYCSKLPRWHYICV